ncbi:MAG: hypothetical protein M1822_004926 [Bathelium mastoideum]|nr:MAG: hypothetical protein M1822_004926 [Bathelium mastoideum]
MAENLPGEFGDWSQGEGSTTEAIINIMAKTESSYEDIPNKSPIENFYKDILNKSLIESKSTEEPILSGYYAMAQSIETLAGDGAVEKHLVPRWQDLLAIRTSEEFFREGNANPTNYLTAKQMDTILTIWGRRNGFKWSLGVRDSSQSRPAHVVSEGPSEIVVWVANIASPGYVYPPIWAGYVRGPLAAQPTRRDSF